MTPRERHDLIYIFGVVLIILVVLAAAYLLS
jgi:hypothetical protein